MTLATSRATGVRPLYVYMQRPDNGEWLTVGAYWLDEESRLGRFKYAPSYEEAGHTWAIDPVNLSRTGRAGEVYVASRYHGLHDVLRDACPDSWGQAVLKKAHQMPENSTPLSFLKVASNADRWGALAVGANPKPSIAALATPRLPDLDSVVRELQAMAERKPAVNLQLRKRLQQTPSLGGARPKATVQDAHGQFWLVKPLVMNDAANIPMLEHFAQSWGEASGMRFASSVYHEENSGLSAIRVLRFDRLKSRRNLCISAASLLQVEFPGAAVSSVGIPPSYPRFAGQLRMIGAPAEDSTELFDRMVFNAVCGNDDDHLRNHAAVFDPSSNCWRLAPAFDVVPNPEMNPLSLALPVNRMERQVSRDSILHDCMAFGFRNKDEASVHLGELLQRIHAGFDMAQDLLDAPLRKMMKKRMQVNLKHLKNELGKP